MNEVLKFRGKTYEIERSQTTDGYQVRINGKRFFIVPTAQIDGLLSLEIDGRPFYFHVANDQDKRWIGYQGRAYTFHSESRSRKRKKAATSVSEGLLRAPMPGQVRAINVHIGQIVEKGETVMVLEAMKMEIRIQSPIRGEVKSIPVVQGTQVDRDQILVEIM